MKYAVVLLMLVFVVYVTAEEANPTDEPSILENDVKVEQIFGRFSEFLMQF